MADPYVPHPYQLHAISNVVRRKYMALFLDPGMGKTSIILRSFVSMQKFGLAKGMLVIAPLRPCYSVWPKETKKWLFSRHLKVEILHGPKKHEALKRPADIYVINPEGLQWLFKTGLKGKRNYPFDIMVVDESGKFKNPKSKRLKHMKPKFNKFRKRIILNGTPAPNGLMDLWSQFYILDQGHTFGRNVTEYRGRYFIPDGNPQYNKWKIAGEAAEDMIYRKAAHMCLVMRAEDHLDMPPITFNDIYVQMPATAMEKYIEVEQELFTEIDSDEIEVKNTAVASMNCRQIASGGLYKPTPEGQKPAPSHKREWYALHEEKTAAMIDLMEELQGKPLLIAYEFQHDLIRIKRAIKKKFGITIPHIGGGVSAEEGLKLEDAWNAGKLRALAAHPAAMSHGLNMQKCGEDILWYTPTWNAEWYQQLIQRIYRQGFAGSKVRVHHLLAENTVDEVVVLRRQKKSKKENDLKEALILYRNSKMELNGSF